MATFNETLIEGFTLTSIPGDLVSESLLDSMTMDDSILADSIAVILEQVNLVDLVNSSGSFSISVSDIVDIADLAAVIFSHSLLENITLDDPLTDIHRRVEILLDQLSLADTGLPSGISNIALSVALALTDISLTIDTIVESVTVNDTLIDLFRASLAIVEEIELTHSTQEYLTFMILVNEDMTGNDTISISNVFQIALSDGWTVSTKFSSGDETYTGWVMNPENYALTNYLNFSFNSSTDFDSTFLFANSSGLYKLGGDTDNGSFITSAIQTASMDFGTSNLKQVPEVLLGTNNSGTLILIVSVDGQKTAYYEVAPSTTNLETQMIKIGKGLYGRYWQYELQTKDNSDFDLDTFEFIPVVFGRKLR